MHTHAHDPIETCTDGHATPCLTKHIRQHTYVRERPAEAQAHNTYHQRALRSWWLVASSASASGSNICAK
eukprot:3669596-Pyramimonas_sp.AAC.1